MVWYLLRSFRATLLCSLTGILLFLLIRATLGPRTSERKGRANVKFVPRPPAAFATPAYDPFTMESPEVSGHDPTLEDLLRAHKGQARGRGSGCAEYPRYENLNIFSPYFQLAQAGNISYFLFGAYYDRRPPIPEVMILTMANYTGKTYPKSYCRMWFEGDAQPLLAPLVASKLCWYPEWGVHPGVGYPTLLTFRVPSHRIPQLVSLVFEDRCAVARNALKVVKPKSESLRVRAGAKLKTAVCVKYLMFPHVDMSERLVEWLELMRILGATKVTAYDIGQLEPNTTRTLKHYADARLDGLLELRDFQFLQETQDFVDQRQRLIEVLLYNDCLYRNMYDFDYIAVVDVDEVLMPLGRYRNWPDLLAELISQDVNCSARSSYCFYNTYFAHQLPAEPDMPKHFHMLGHLTRVANYSRPGDAMKCLHNTQSVTMVHNHFPLDWREACLPKDVSVEMGHMQHYRHADIPQLLKDPPPLRDDNIRRFRHQLIRNAIKVHRQLGWGSTTNNAY